MAQTVPQRQYRFTLKGISPLILHNDDVDWADYIDSWRNDPAHKQYQKKRGDDRLPGFLWIGSLYHDGTHIALPAENLHRALRDGATRIATGKRTETFKRQSQSGMGPTDAFFPLLDTNNNPFPYAPFLALVENQERDFPVHRELVRQQGFELLVKRAPVASSKHVRVRPLFKTWGLTGTMSVWDDTITTDTLRLMFEITGRQIGLGDWRPSAPMAPGHYGRFEAEVEQVK